MFSSPISVLGFCLFVAVFASSQGKSLKEIEKELQKKGDIVFVSSSDKSSSLESRSLGHPLLGDEAVLVALNFSLSYAYNPEGHPIIKIESRSLDKPELKFQPYQIPVLSSVLARPNGGAVVTGNPLLYRGHNIKDVNRENSNKYREIVDIRDLDVSTPKHQALFGKLDEVAQTLSNQYGSEVQLVPVIAFIEITNLLPILPVQFGVARIDLSGAEDPALLVVELPVRLSR
ncbi:hypothetical protein DdX_14169 [Ditylenchus destructor]|uniref:Uncharacterized protein n=1 Tax=Ditylenchus destructor TaxID=166010 RepID=A0AAD4MS96_9BILA|nr:hypothetical protein DdX_14169 [Ditylenchus destructor]